jgi:hypothetical protein
MAFCANGYYRKSSRHPSGAAEHVALSVERTVGVAAWPMRALVLLLIILGAVLAVLSLGPDADGMGRCQLQHSHDVCFLALVG